MDAHVDQLCAWRTDAQGRSIRQLTRDMVMATLFAESEALVLANRPAENKKRNWSGGRSESDNFVQTMADTWRRQGGDYLYSRDLFAGLIACVSSTPSFESI